MKIVPLEFPADLAQAVQRNNDHVPKEAAKLLALELFRQGKVSISRAAELCEIPPPSSWNSRLLMGARPVNYGIEELETDRRTLAKLRA
jgi:predicted HTH domain antitoxin